MTTREDCDCLEWLNDFGSVVLYADFESKEVGTNVDDSYYDVTFDMDEFLEFADRIRKRLESKK